MMLMCTSFIKTRDPPVAGAGRLHRWKVMATLAEADSPCLVPSHHSSRLPSTGLMILMRMEYKKTNSKPKRRVSLNQTFKAQGRHLETAFCWHKGSILWLQFFPHNSHHIPIFDDMPCEFVRGTKSLAVGTQRCFILLLASALTAQAEPVRR